MKVLLKPQVAAVTVSCVTSSTEDQNRWPRPGWLHSLIRMCSSVVGDCLKETLWRESLPLTSKAVQGTSWSPQPDDPSSGGAWAACGHMPPDCHNSGGRAGCKFHTGRSGGCVCLGATVARQEQATRRDPSASVQSRLLQTGHSGREVSHLEKQLFS